MIISNMSNYNTNDQISAIIFISKSTHLFSINTDNNAAIQLQKAISTFINNNTNTIKNVITVYSGLFTGNTYSTFATSNYKLATPSTHLIISELLDNKIPSLGLAYYMTNSSPYGLAVARYAAVSGRPLMSMDLYSLGLVTHIVEQRPHVHLCEALAHTVPDRKITEEDRVSVSAEKKIVFGDDESGEIADDNSWPELTTSPFGKVIVDDALGDLLDTMHVADPVIDGKSLDVMSDKIWDKMLLVKPSELPRDPYLFSADVTTADVGDKLPREDMDTILSDVVRVFSTDSVDECLSLLQSEALNGKDWAEKAHRSMTVIDRGAVTRWFEITRLAESGASYEDVLSAEKKLL